MLSTRGTVLVRRATSRLLVTNLSRIQSLSGLRALSSLSRQQIKQSAGCLQRLPTQLTPHSQKLNVLISRKFSATATETKTEEHRSSQSEAPDKGVATWLFICAGMVFTMVVVGGLTRLTKSGLSMVEWKFTGERPPRTQAEWEKEFLKYQQYPEYKKMNRGMTLSEFKFIYFMEWSHRMLGRAVGVVFGLPLVYFIARGRIRGPMVKYMLGLFGLGGAQGLIGWWMVRSGLEEPEHEHSEPKVSPYRLTVHLASAFLIYSLLFTSGMRAWKGRPLPAVPGGIPAPLRRAAVATTALIGLTVLSGAFVGGNRAGLVYNEFPLMGGRIFPQDAVDPQLKPAWRNMFENSSLVQFNHRFLATSTLFATTALFLYGKRVPGLSRNAYLALHSLTGMATVQATLGICTLLWHVPVPLASSHQAGSLTLLTIALWCLHALGPARGSSAALQQTVKVASTAAASKTSASAATGSMSSMLTQRGASAVAQGRSMPRMLTLRRTHTSKTGLFGKAQGKYTRSLPPSTP